MKKIDLQKTEEQLKHHEVERIGSKDPPKLRKSDTDPHRRKDEEKEDEIILSKHYRGSLLNKIVNLYDIFLTGSNQYFQIASIRTARYVLFTDGALLLSVGWQKKLGFRGVDNSRYVHDRMSDWRSDWICRYQCRG